VNGFFRVVFDTNILFSAVGWLGNPHLCVQAARHGKCLSLTCEPILAELAEKLQFKRGLDASRAAETAEEIRAFSRIIMIPGALKVIAADPDDDAILECAVVGQAQYLVVAADVFKHRPVLRLKTENDAQVVGDGKTPEFGQPA